MAEGFSRPNYTLKPGAVRRLDRQIVNRADRLSRQADSNLHPRFAESLKIDPCIMESIGRITTLGYRLDKSPTDSDVWRARAVRRGMVVGTHFGSRFGDHLVPPDRHTTLLLERFDDLHTAIDQAQSYSALTDLLLDRSATAYEEAVYGILGAGCLYYYDDTEGLIQSEQSNLHAAALAYTGSVALELLVAGELSRPHSGGYRQIERIYASRKRTNIDLAIQQELSV